MRQGTSLRSIRNWLAGLGGLGVVTLAGCGIPGYYPGGSLASQDKFVYYSTIDNPTSVKVVNYHTGETIWSYDIPVEQQLVVDFDPGDGSESFSATPDIMKWGVMPLNTRFRELENRIRVPSQYDRRIEMTIRETAEVPERAPSGTEAQGLQ